MSDNVQDYSGAAAAQAAAQASSALLQSTGNITASTFNFKNTKKLAKYQNEMNIENWNKQNEYNEKMALNYNNQIMQAARNAGLNPVAAMSGPHFAQSVGSIPSSSLSNSATVVPPDFSGLSDVALRSIEARQFMHNIDRTTTDIDKILAEIRGLDLNNTFLSDTLRSKIDLTNEQNKMWTDIASKVNSNPDFIKAYAEEKYVQNRLAESSTSLNKAIEELNKAQTEKVGEEKLNLIQERFLTQAKIALTKTQRQTLIDQNFRENSSNVSWLLNKINETYDDPKLTQSQKAQKISVYNAALDQVSKVSEYGRQRKLNNQQAENQIVVDDNKGRNAIENTREFGRQMRQTNEEQVINNTMEKVLEISVDKARDVFIDQPREEREFNDWKKKDDYKNDPENYFDREIERSRRKQQDKLRRMKSVRNLFDKFRHKSFQDSFTME